MCVNLPGLSLSVFFFVGREGKQQKHHWTKPKTRITFFLSILGSKNQMTPKIREDDGFFTTSFEKKPGVVFYLFPALSHISHFSQGMETLWVWNVFLHLVPWRNRRFWMTFLKSFFFLWQRYPIVNVDGSERNPVSCWWPVIYDGFLYIIVYIPGGFLAGFLKHQQYQWGACFGWNTDTGSTRKTNRYMGKSGP